MSTLLLMVRSAHGILTAAFEFAANHLDADSDVLISVGNALDAAGSALELLEEYE